MGTVETVSLLIIEDNANDRLLLKKMLHKIAKISRLGFRVRIVSSGRKGLQYALDMSPDIILLDVHLADISGLQILKQLQSNHMLRETVVLLMTADVSEATALSGLTAGASDIIFKPLRTIELALKIANLLEMKESRRQLFELNMKLEEEKKVLSKFFTSDLLEHIKKERGEGDLSGIQTFATILFFRVHNMADLSDKGKPMEFGALLSDIYNGVSSIIYAGYGSVNRFLSQGILATFGTPVVYANDAYNALRATEGILSFMEEFIVNNPNLRETPPVYSIGIASGPIFAGNIGSKRRIEYTVTGTAVEMSEQLSLLAKEEKLPYLVDAMTAEVLQDIIESAKLENSKPEAYAIHSIDIAKAEELYINTQQVTYDNLSEIGDVEFF